MSSTPAKMLLLACASVFLLTACERKPEDLEKWRDAKGGMEKMVGWAKDKEQSEAVRIRAIEILMEEGESSTVAQVLPEIKDEALRTTLADATVPIIETFWAANDVPTIDKEAAKETGGRVRIPGGTKMEIAKDAAYYMHPFVSEANKPKLVAIMAKWMSADQEVRDQLGNVTLAQMLPLSGPEGMAGMIGWFKVHKQPGVVAKAIREHADDKAKSEFAKAVAEVANERHPEIDVAMSTIILETQDEAVVPYLKRALADEKSPDHLISDAMDGLALIQGPRATPFFAQAVGNMRGLKRWAAATQLISLRGEAGIKQVPTALPLQLEGYDAGGDERLELNSKYFCNLAKSELALDIASKKDPEIKKKGNDQQQEAIKANEAAAMKKLEPIVGGMLDSPRWTSQALGVRCAEVHKLAALKPKVEALAKSKQTLAGWGDKSLGEFAGEVAAKL